VNLVQKKCVPCEHGTSPLSDAAEDALMALIASEPAWKIERTGVHRLSKRFSFDSYSDAISFVNRVAVVAEREQHHPSMKIGYRTVTIECTTHAARGLSENDFIIAAKIEKISVILKEPPGVLESSML
jgi:4a-hydroxytetrahydrobiopterin dehydratase